MGLQVSTSSLDEKILQHRMKKVQMKEWDVDILHLKLIDISFVAPYTIRYLSVFFSSWLFCLIMLSFLFMTKICQLPAVTVWFIGKLHPEYILWVTPPISNPTFEQTLSISFDWLVNANIRHLSLIKNKDNFNMDSKCLFFLSYFL